MGSCNNNNQDQASDVNSVMDDDLDDREDTKRKSRNLSEKKRRDQFNMLVNELSSMVATNNRKMDKSTVLKSTIAFLKSHYEVSVRSRAHEIQEDWKPPFLSNEEFTHLILEALDGFILVFSTSGRIFYASESMMSLLGHVPGDLYNTSIYELAHEQDRSNIYSLLQNSSIPAVDHMHGNFSEEHQVVLMCHLKRGCLDFKDEPLYELVQLIGYFRANVDVQDLDTISNPQCSDNISENDTRVMFVCTGRLQTPHLIKEMSVVESSKTEFTSRHSLEWKFLFLDHRAPPIIGYLPFEVLGTSGYDYYHFDDLDNVVTCHEALMQKGEGTSCYYRFLTKGQQWIWLQTRFYITYHQWNSKPEFVVCTHRVISYVDVIKNMQKDNQSFDSEQEMSQIPEFDKNKYASVETNEYRHQRMSQPSSQDTSWSKLSSKTSKYSVASESQKTNSNAGQYSMLTCSSCTDSDTASISADSIGSRQSEGIHRSSSRSKTKHYSHHASTSSSQKHKQQQQHQQQHHHQQQQQQQQQQHQLQQQQHQQQQQIVSSSHLSLPSMHPNMSAAGPYMDQPQYLTVPVLGPQSVIGSQDMGVLIMPAQPQIEEQLQKKHEELQQMIIHQQEELRRVSEQLVMARYRLLPPILNVSLPYNVQNGIPMMHTGDVYPDPQISQPAHWAPPPDPQVHHHHPPSDPNEYMPMQMSQQQAQILFSTPNNRQNNNRDGSA